MYSLYIHSILQYVGCQQNVGKKVYAYNMKNNLFGKNLRELRQEKGYSQRKLGELIGVCNQTISFWETGSREPDLEMLVKIADFFEVSVDYLLGKGL